MQNSRLKLVLGAIGVIGALALVAALPAVVLAYCPGACPTGGYQYVGGSTTVTNTNTNTNNQTNTSTNTNTNNNTITINNHVGGYSYQPVNQPYYQPPMNTLVCSPITQNTSVNQTVSLTASGGYGSYSWTAPESYLQTSFGQSIQVSYPTAGTKVVTVRSDNQTATCYVNVTGGQVLADFIEFPDTGAGGAHFMRQFGAFFGFVILLSVGAFLLARRQRA